MFGIQVVMCVFPRGGRVAKHAYIPGVVVIRAIMYLLVGGGVGGCVCVCVCVWGGGGGGGYNRGNMGYI